MQLLLLLAALWRCRGEQFHGEHYSNCLHREHNYAHKRAAGARLKLGEGLRPESQRKHATHQDEPAQVCEAALFAVGAGDCWPRIVEAGLDDPRKLLSRFDNELEALGIPPDAFPRLRCGLGRYRDSDQ